MKLSQEEAWKDVISRSLNKLQKEVSMCDPRDDVRDKLFRERTYTEVARIIVANLKTFKITNAEMCHVRARVYDLLKEERLFREAKEEEERRNVRAVNERVARRILTTIHQETLDDARKLDILAKAEELVKHGGVC